MFDSPAQSAFIGTSLALQSFKDEFGLKTGTAEEKARFNDLSANIVSTYRECLLHPSVLIFSSLTFFLSFSFCNIRGRLCCWSPVLILCRPLPRA
jgi:hypothetical protein